MLNREQPLCPNLLGGWVGIRGPPSPAFPVHRVLPHVLGDLGQILNSQLSGQGVSCRAEVRVPPLSRAERLSRISLRAGFPR